MNIKNNLDLIQKVSKTTLVGLSLVVLSLGIFASIKGDLFKQGPSIVIAEDDSGGSSGGVERRGSGSGIGGIGISGIGHGVSISLWYSGVVGANYPVGSPH
jgi:hypothetical protein